MLTPTMIALRKSPRNIHWIKKTSTQPKSEILQHRMRRHMHERHAVVERHDLHPGRQAAVVIHLVDRGDDSRDDILGVERAPHDDDALDHIVVMVFADDAKPRHVTDIYPRHILDSSPARRLFA